MHLLIQATKENFILAQRLETTGLQLWFILMVKVTIPISTLPPV